MLNKVDIMGRLTKDVETKSVGENNLVANFTIACDRDFVKEGEDRQADFIPVVYWNPSQKFADKYLKQGELVVVSGRLQTRTWDDSDGNRHYVTEIKADNVYPTNFKKPQEG